MPVRSPQFQGARPALWVWALADAGARLPTSDDQVLQGGPAIGEVPLLACVPERGRDAIVVGQDLAVLEGSRHCCDCGWRLDREPRPGALRKPPVPSLACSPGLSAVPWWPQRDPQAETGTGRERGGPCQVPAQSGGDHSHPLPPHLQVFQSLVHSTRVREAAGPERGEVGWIKLGVLLPVLKVIVEPDTPLLIPQDGLHGGQALDPQAFVLGSLDIVPWEVAPLAWAGRAGPWDLQVPSGRTSESAGASASPLTSCGGSPRSPQPLLLPPGCPSLPPASHGRRLTSCHGLSSPEGLAGPRAQGQ